ncbi:MAG: prepilin-type N-terminal cleavage/methylation domain-containing protein [Verrucomicrobiae bacterium]|nr:prepilin-type N-terminal cleavage/methylation domain-containing protein [Verrucomicrobiae bacterium]
MQLKVKQSAAGLVFRYFAGGKPLGARGRNRSGGFTLVEVLISAAIMGLVFGTVINCYIQSGQRLEWTGYSLAAQSMATQVVEQARAANWDPTAVPPVNNLMTMNLMATNYDSPTRTFTGYSVSVLDVPYSSTNYTLATNFVTVQIIYVNGDPKVQMQFVQVNTVWPFYLRNGNACFTNTVSTMVAPDDRQI